jgi:hypothetical protein
MTELALFSLSALKTFLKLKGTDDAQDDVLATIGQAASDYCESRIGERFKARDYTIVRDGDDRDKLLRLPRSIVSVASLTIDGIAIASTDYVIYVDDGKIRLKQRRFTAGVGNVSVVLTAGYADDALPGHIVAAALDLAKSHYEEWMNGAISLSSINIGSVNAIIRPGLNPRVEKYLDSMRDVRA